MIWTSCLSKASLGFVVVAVVSVFTTEQGLATATDSPASYDIEAVPRLEVWQGGRAIMREVYGRLALDGSRQTGPLALRARAEGFAAYDFAEEERRPFGSPDLRKSRNEADLNELWVDFTFDTLGIRVGRQPIRWSQSWTLPSLDILTGRRSNRLFMDPLIDQLTHPDAIRLTKSISVGEHTVEFEAVRVLRSAPNNFAEPIRNQDRVDLETSAAKVSTRFGSLDIGGIFRSSGKSTIEDNLVGAFASYAFESIVAKFEGAVQSRNSRFVMLGADWFIGSWVLGPQVTVFDDPLLGARGGTALAFVPVRYSEDKWTFEFDCLQSFGGTDALLNRFLSARVGREIEDGLVFSLGIQDYRGNALALLGQGEMLTGGTIFGMRLEYTGGWAK